MPLSPVAQGDPHVAAHNAERTLLNAVESSLGDAADSISDVNTLVNSLRNVVDPAFVAALHEELDAAAAGEFDFDAAQIGNEVTLPNPASYFTRYYLDENQGSFGSSPNRLQFMFMRSGTSVYRETGGFNEYGELRVIPAKANTVPFRLFTRYAPTDPAHDVSVPMFEIMNDRTNRVSAMRVMTDGSIQTDSDLAVGDDVTVGGDVAVTGTVTAANIGAKVVTVPDGASGFASQPNGTLWIEYGPAV